MNLFGEESANAYKSLIGFSTDQGLFGLGNNDLDTPTDGFGIQTGISIGKQAFRWNYYANAAINDAAATPVSGANLAYNSSDKFYYKNSGGLISLIATEAYVNAAIIAAGPWDAVTGGIEYEQSVNGDLFARVENTSNGTAAVAEYRLTNPGGSARFRYYSPTTATNLFITANGLLIENQNGNIAQRIPTGQTYQWWVDITKIAGISGTGFQLFGSTSGTATIVVPAIAASPTLTLPTTSGTFALLGDLGLYLLKAGDTYTLSPGANGLALTTSTLTSGSLVNLASTGTTAGSNTQTVLNIATSGANGTASQTTYGFRSNNTHTGASSVNIGAQFGAVNGATNIALITTTGDVYFHSGTWVYNATTDNITHTASKAAGGDLSETRQNSSSAGSTSLYLLNNASIGLGISMYGSAWTPSGSGLDIAGGVQISTGVLTNLWVGTNDFSIWNGASGSPHKNFTFNSTGFTLFGSSSGGAIIVAPAAAGSPTLTLPTTTGTFALVGSTVSSITGTANQVLVNAGSGSPVTGAITLTLPQSIATSSTPSFAGIGLTGLLTSVVAMAKAIDISPTTGTDAIYGLIHNTGGDLVMGVNNNAGNALATGATANASVIYNNNNLPLQFGTQSVIRYTISGVGNHTRSIPNGNAGLTTGMEYYDTAAQILANGDLVVGRKA